MVKVSGHMFAPQWVRSGVTQGSVLGPLLFIVMMIAMKYLALQSNLDSVWLDCFS